MCRKRNNSGDHECQNNAGFSDAAVKEEDLHAILQSGLAATSAINQQPWYFVAITNPDVMEEISGNSAMGGIPAGMAPPEGVTMPAGMSLLWA